METPPPELSPTKPGLRARLFRWRTLRYALIGLAGLLTLIALVYTEENWRGRRAWNEYRRNLEAAGEQLDLAAFISKPVPDEQNFAATPFIESWFHKENFRANHGRLWKDSYAEASAQVVQPLIQDKGRRRFMDLAAWKMAFEPMSSEPTNSNQSFKSGKLDHESRAQAAPAVLDGLKMNESIFEELRAASARPYSRYPVIYNLDNPWSILLPHLANLKSVVQRLQLRACAELAVGQSTNALADVKLMLHVADSVREESFLISYMVRVACLQIAIQPIWEGLAEHAWSDAQLQELQARFQPYDFLIDLKRSLDGERAAGVLTAKLVREKGYGYLQALAAPGNGRSALSASSVRWANLCGRMVPRGWYDLEQLNYCRSFQQGLAGAFDVSRKTVSPGKLESSFHGVEREISGGTPRHNALWPILHHRAITALLLPALNKTPLKAAVAQVITDQAGLACALERYRLAHGSFPEKLETLMPQFIHLLPNDPLTGEPYKYRRTDDGQFVLYSVGWDEKDDDGTPGKVLYDDRQGDWVWQYPHQD